MMMCFLGRWPHQAASKKRIIHIWAIFGGLSLLLPVWIKLYESRNNFNDMLLALPMAITFIFYYLTLGFFMINAPQILLLLNWMAKDFKEMESNENELTILQKSAAEGHYIVKIYARISTIGYCLEVVLAPAFLDLIIPLNETRKKMQLAEMDYVIFDADANYYATFMHIAIVGPYSIGAIVTADVMLYTFCQHACGMFRVLRYRLMDIRNIKDINNVEEMYLKGVASVNLYNTLIEYINLLNSCYTAYLFIEVGFEILLMSFQGAMIVIKHDDARIVTSYGTYYLASLIHLFFNSIPGQKLLDHSRELTNDICYTEWYDLPPKVKKLFLMIMTRSMKESKIMIGNVFTLGVETYSSILKTIFSYLSVLTTVKG